MPTIGSQHALNLQLHPFPILVSHFRFLFYTVVTPLEVLENCTAMGYSRYDPCLLWYTILDPCSCIDPTLQLMATQGLICWRGMGLERERCVQGVASQNKDQRIETWEIMVRFTTHILPVHFFLLGE